MKIKFVLLIALFLLTACAPPYGTIGTPTPIIPPKILKVRVIGVLPDGQRIQATEIYGIIGGVGTLPDKEGVFMLREGVEYHIKFPDNWFVPTYVFNERDKNENIQEFLVNPMLPDRG